MSERRLTSAFRRSPTRKIFFWLVIFVSALLLIVRYWLGGMDFSEVTGDVLESLFSTFIAALGIAAFLRFFVPTEADQEISMLEPRDLYGEFNDLLNKSNSWRYKGNFGRYFRTSVLSTLSRRGVEQHLSIHVECIVINPDNTDLCRRHALARNSVRTADGKRNWDERDVRIEVYATILCCFIYKNTLSLRLGLLEYFEPQRFDIAESAIIVTREDTRAPAVRIGVGGYLFSAALRDYQVAMDQSRNIDLIPNSLSFGSINKDVAKDLLIKAGLDKEFISSAIDIICEKASLTSNPYVK